MFEPNYWHWWILACLLLVMELLLPGVFFMWPAIAAAVMGAVVFFIPHLSLGAQIIIFAVMSAISVFVWYMYLRQHPTESEDPLLNQRLARYIGRTVTLSEAIVNGMGRAKIGDTLWQVSGPDCPAGSKVKVVDADGMLLKVEIVASE